MCTSSVAPVPMMWTPSSRRSSRWKSILKQPAVVAEDLAARDLAVARDARSRTARSSCVSSLLGRARPSRSRGSRRCRSGSGRPCGAAATPKAWQAASRPCSLDVAARLGIADHVAGREDVRHRRAELASTAMRPAIVGGEARRPRGSARRSRRARPTEKSTMSATMRLPDSRSTARRGARGPSRQLDRRHRLAEAESDVPLPHLVDQLVHDLGVDELERPVAPLDQRHLRRRAPRTSRRTRCRSRRRRPRPACAAGASAARCRRW